MDVALLTTPETLANDSTSCVQYWGMKTAQTSLPKCQACECPASPSPEVVPLLGAEMTGRGGAISTPCPRDHGLRCCSGLKKRVH